MVKRSRVVMNSAGATDVLSSPAIQAEIRAIVNGIAARANAVEGLPRTERGEIYGFEPSVIASPHTRAGGRVTAVGPSARRRNAANNTILKSMGGGG